MRAAYGRLVEKVETYEHVHMIKYNRWDYLVDLKEANESTKDINDRELLDLLTKKSYKIHLPGVIYYERLRFQWHHDLYQYK
jgi:hypothetical protein